MRIMMRLFNNITVPALGFIGMVVLGWVLIWWALAQQPLQVPLDLTNPLVADGTFGRDPEGVWLTGNTQIVSDRFGDSPWREFRWRWRQAPGTPLQVRLRLESREFVVTSSPQWRVVHVLMPAVWQHTPFDIRSGTITVAGDSRALGVIIGQLQVVRLATPPWWLFVVVCDYWLPLLAAGIWLWRSRWVGFGPLVALVAIHVTTIWLEAPLGFANASLLLDRTGRYICTVLMLWWSWQQTKRVPLTRIPHGHRFGLDVMRAIAILCVAVTHFTPLVLESWYLNRDYIRWERYLGALGVDIFFALSGYLIGGILLRTLPQMADFAVVRRFWVRRWLRTLPAAYVSAIVVVIVATPVVWPDYWARVLFVSSLTPYLNGNEMRAWWSLATEEYFYLLCPLLLYFFMRTRHRQWAFFGTLTILGLAGMLARAGWLAVLPTVNIGGIEIVPYARLDPMIWGVVIAWVRFTRPEWFVRLNTIGYAPGMVLLSVGFMLLLDKLRWLIPGLFLGHMLITGGAALMIPAIESIVTTGWRVFDRMLIGIAALSYSIYLYHDMIVIFLERHFGHSYNYTQLAYLFGAYVVLTVGISWLSHKFVETPFLRWRDQRFPDH